MFSVWCKVNVCDFFLSTGFTAVIGSLQWGRKQMFVHDAHKMHNRRLDIGLLPRIPSFVVDQSMSDLW